MTVPMFKVGRQQANMLFLVVAVVVTLLAATTLFIAYAFFGRTPTFNVIAVITVTMTLFFLLIGWLGTRMLMRLFGRGRLGSIGLATLGVAIFLVTLLTPIPGDEILGFLVMVALVFVSLLLIALGGGVPRSIRGFLPQTRR